MTNLKKLHEDYLLRGQDRYFSSGRRSALRYAVRSRSVYFTQLNPKGPEPFEYLEYAKSDLASGSAHGSIDALGHAKRAVHLIMEALLKVWGLDKAYRNANFQEKLKVMHKVNAFPTRLIGQLNHKRNLVEHKYESVNQKEAADFVDIAEMFLMLSYPFLKHAVIGAYVGLNNDDRCLEWRIEIPKREIHILLVNCEKAIDSAIGRIHYNIGDKDKRSLQSVVPLRRDNLNEWLPFLDLFVYCTKRLIVTLPVTDSRGHGFFTTSHSITVFDMEETNGIANNPLLLTRPSRMLIERGRT
jgi:hypothetical protein